MVLGAVEWAGVPLAILVTKTTGLITGVVPLNSHLPPKKETKSSGQEISIIKKATKTSADITDLYTRCKVIVDTKKSTGSLPVVKTKSREEKKR